MKYLSTFEVAEKWGISHRRVGILCNENRIPRRTEGGWTMDYSRRCREASRCKNQKRKIRQDENERITQTGKGAQSMERKYLSGKHQRAFAGFDERTQDHAE